MSSILEALKKLETETPADRKGSGMSLKEPGPASLGSRTAGYLYRHGRVIAICLAVLAAGGVLVIARGSSLFSAPKKEPVRETVRSKTPSVTKAVALPASKTTQPGVRSELDPDSRQRASSSQAVRVGKGMSRHALPAPAPPPARPPVGATRPEPQKSLRTAAVRAAEEIKKEPETARKMKPEGEGPETAKSETASLAQERALNLPPGSGLVLQAISWNQEPEKRLAVINNRIIREGQRIDEYTLESIGRDDLILSRSGSLWRFGFER